MSQKLSVAKKIMLNQHGRASSHILVHVHVWDIQMIVFKYYKYNSKLCIIKIEFFFISFLA